MVLPVTVSAVEGLAPVLVLVVAVVAGALVGLVLSEVVLLVGEAVDVGGQRHCRREPTRRRRGQLYHAVVVPVAVVVAVSAAAAAARGRGRGGSPRIGPPAWAQAIQWIISFLKSSVLKRLTLVFLASLINSGKDDWPPLKKRVVKFQLNWVPGLK